MEAPFQHKIQEPWDQKYINSPDNIGLATKERYEIILKSESYKNIFGDYYFYYNAFDANDKLNPKENKIFPNIHHKLQNTNTGLKNHSQSTSLHSSSSSVNLNIKDISSMNSSNNNLGGSSGSTSMRSLSVIQGNYNGNQKENEIIINNNKNSVLNNQVNFKKIEGSSEPKVISSIDSKLSKLKQINNSGSASTLLRQYRVSGISSYSGSGNNQNQVSNFSSLMSNQNRSSLGGNSFISSSNSTSSTSNQPQMGSIKKSGSTNYLK